MSEKLVKAGYVTSVSGAKVTGVLAMDKAGGAPSADASKPLQIGSLVKVMTSESIAFGVISGLAIENPSSPPEPSDRRRLLVPARCLDLPGARLGDLRSDPQRAVPDLRQALGHEH